MSPTLVRPDARYKDSYIAALKEFLAEGRRPPWHFDKLQDEFPAFVNTQLDRELRPLPGVVAESIFWLIGADGQTYLGESSLRHYLTEALRRHGGHVGYRIRPSARRKGYGTLICKLTLDEMRRRGYMQALITCDDTNVGSRKIIEANGGYLESVELLAGHDVPTRRYWVNL